MSNPNAIATFEAVAAACEAIEGAGARVSVRAVMNHIGGGSPNKVLEHLNKWREQRPVIEARKAIVIDERIAGLISEQIATAVREATAEANAQRDEAVADRDLMKSSADKFEALSIEQATALAAAGERAQRDAGKIEQLESDLEKERTDSAEAIRAERVAATEAVDKARAEAAAERANADKLRSELGAAQARVDALQAQLAELRDVRAQRDTEHSARVKAETALAGATSESRAVTARLEDITDRANKAETALAAERTARGAAEISAAAAKAAADERAARIKDLEGQLATARVAEKRLNDAIAAGEVGGTAGEKKA